jgi:hypothetical protein
MTQKSFFALLLTVFLLSGCATYGLYDANSQFSQYSAQQSSSEHGYLVFSDFDIPQSTSRTFNLVNGIPGYAYVDIYDVTNDLSYLGAYAVVPPVGSLPKSFMEHYLAIGKHTFMLIYKNKWMGEWEYLTDFIEVNITKEHTTHVSISFYKHKQHPISGAWIYRPKFTQILLDEKSFQFCMQNIGEQEAKEENLLNFMQRESIDSKQLSFKSYCQSLYGERKSIFFLTEKNRAKFIQEKSEIEKVYKKDYPSWKNSLNKKSIFPLIQPQWVTQEK